MKQNNNEQIVFDMFEEVATESIAEARNAYTYEEIDGCYQDCLLYTSPSPRDRG